MTAYKIIPIFNKNSYEKLVSETTLEYEKLFKIKLPYQPCLIFLDSREKFNSINGKNTPIWQNGLTISNLIFLLDEDGYPQSTDHRFDHNKYLLMIRHELCHLFYRALSHNISNPRWLNEGVAIYFSGQTQIYKKITKFGNFLDFWDFSYFENQSGDVYQESGSLIELLVTKFGNEKLFLLISKLAITDSKENFSSCFKDIYGFDLSYSSLNHLL